MASPDASLRQPTAARRRRAERCCPLWRTWRCQYPGRRHRHLRGPGIFDAVAARLVGRGVHPADSLGLPMPPRLAVDPRKDEVVVRFAACDNSRTW